MHPEFFTVPFLGLDIKMYGFCMMVGFLSAVWLAMRRAQRVKANPDTVLDLSLLCLIFGVGGARAFYVFHYWQSQFAGVPNPFWAVIDITSGGLEFLGGILASLVAIVAYAFVRRMSLRLYLDIIAPSVMWGLAFGRIGCFLNGCCFGGPCTPLSESHRCYPWAVRFPFASPAHWRQWEDRQVTAPAELIVTSRDGLQPVLIPVTQLSSSVERRDRPVQRFQEARKAYEDAKKLGANEEELSSLKAVMDSAAKRARETESELGALRQAMRYPSRNVPTRSTSVSELEQLAGLYRSVPVHPTQLYAAVNAMLLSLLLSSLFYLRKRHGLVIGVMFVLYPIPRLILEQIRADNPPDVFGLTASQFISLCLLLGGIAYVFILYRWCPERSPVIELESAGSQAAPKP